MGRRLYSRYPSPAIGDLSREQQHQHQQGQHRRPSAEPLRLGSRGEQDHWRGRLCGVRVWGAGSQAVDIRRRIASLPSVSLVRPAPPPSFSLTVPGTQEAFRRLRLHAPLPDVLEDVSEPSASPLGGQGRRAYYEVRSFSVGVRSWHILWCFNVIIACFFHANSVPRGVAVNVFPTTRRGLPHQGVGLSGSPSSWWTRKRARKTSHHVDVPHLPSSIQRIYSSWYRPNKPSCRSLGDSTLWWVHANRMGTSLFLPLCSPSRGRRRRMQLGC